MPDLPFVTLDVFTATRYLGNPLAIVHIPHSVAESDRPTHEQRLRVAQEFNLSETVFVEDPVPSAVDNSAAEGYNEYEGKEVKIYIYGKDREMPFAGHPTVGTTAHLLGAATGRRSAAALTLLTKAGSAPATIAANGYARLEVPHAITIHEHVLSLDRAAELVGIDRSAILSNHASGQEGVSVVSIVDGLAFVFVRVASVEALSATKLTGNWLTRQELGLGDTYGANVSQYVYCITETAECITRLQTRLLKSTWEDPATGSAASCLSGFLSIRGGGAGMQRFEITQGVDMGRKSEIVVEVHCNEKQGGSVVENIWLSTLR